MCGSRGYGSLHTVASGSVARGLAHRAACPLLVTPRSQTTETRDVWAGHPAGQHRLSSARGASHDAPARGSEASGAPRRAR